MKPSTPILIAAINARHSHASLGARCLLANMGDLRAQTELAEFTLQQSAAEIADAIAARQPRLLGLGVYIWNAVRVAELLPLLRENMPHLKIVLGGPETAETEHTARQGRLALPEASQSDCPEVGRTLRVSRAVIPPAVSARPPNPSHSENPVLPVQTAVPFDADFLILGEGDIAFPALCRDLLSAPQLPPGGSDPRGLAPRVNPVRQAPFPDLTSLRLPYDEYTDSDLAQRILYVESSRGCDMRCDYCVSANDASVRFFPMPALLAAFDRLLARGARQFKFCDRSFNLHVPRAIRILSFFLERAPRNPGLFLHFEMRPDRFPGDLRTLLSRFPPHSLQLEIGIQSFHPRVLETIRRPQDLESAAGNLRFLRKHTHAFLHTDLIAGLPGETPDSFAAGFDRLVALGPHEIQLGILKKLPGAPIARHDAAFAMRYASTPPYAVHSTRDWPAGHLARTARFAHWWDAIVSSNRFPAAAPLLWQDTPSVFGAFMAFSDWMGERFPREHGIPLAALVEAVFDYLTQSRRLSPGLAADALLRGYRHAGARDIPPALAPHLRRPPPPPLRGLPRSLRRQYLRWTWEEVDPARKDDTLLP